MSAQNPLFTNSYFSSMLYYKNWNPSVYNFNSPWIMAWKALQTGELFGKSIATADPMGRFETLIKNRYAVQAISATTTLVGANLVVTFVNPLYDQFRIKDKVTDGKMFVGYVIATTPGTITIAPLNNPTVFVAATHFAVNSTITSHGTLSGLYNSVGTTNIFEPKDNQEDYVEITRDTYQVSAFEKTNRFAAGVGSDMEVYGYTDNEADMVNRAIKNTMFKKFFGKGGTGLVGLEGQMNITYGMRNRLIDSSGNYISGSAPITLGQLTTLVGNAADAYPAFDQDVIIMPGRRALSQIATFFPTQIGFIGGRREGDRLSISLDVREIILAGVNVKVVTNLNILNDSVNLPDWMKDSVWVLNRSATTVNGQNRSLIQPIHFSQNPNSEYRPLYRCIPGMVGIGDTDSTGLATLMGNYQITASNVHGAACEYLDASGISMIPYGHGLFEYIHP